MKYAEFEARRKMQESYEVAKKKKEKHKYKKL